MILGSPGQLAQVLDNGSRLCGLPIFSYNGNRHFYSLNFQHIDILVPQFLILAFLPVNFCFLFSFFVVLVSDNNIDKEFIKLNKDNHVFITQ